MATIIPIEDCGTASMDFGGKTFMFDLFDVFDEIAELHRKTTKPGDSAFTVEFKSGVKTILARITGAPATSFTSAVANQFQARVYDAAQELQKKTLGPPNPTPVSSDSTTATLASSTPSAGGC